MQFQFCITDWMCSIKISHHHHSQWILAALWNKKRGVKIDSSFPFFTFNGDKNGMKHLLDAEEYIVKLSPLIVHIFTSSGKTLRDF